MLVIPRRESVVPTVFRTSIIFKMRGLCSNFIFDSMPLTIFYAVVEVYCGFSLMQNSVFGRQFLLEVFIFPVPRQFHREAPSELYFVPRNVNRNRSRLLFHDEISKNFPTSRKMHLINVRQRSTSKILLS